MVRTSIDSASGDDDPVESLVKLRAIADERTELDRREYFLVLGLREQNVSWEAIAAALGVSRQAVHKRFRRKMVGPVR
ncbi:helix-turn-helix transcriptional regulator [Gordonia phthalatica]|uniref:Uncharacterized protein n=1 Tax=Gordonia phthalatica TaxID=1136941 RepID=A0A0N9NEM9_9ACTN|nr:helix-turn-helix transcriptional regulator [Gordonia phthalatica]ALG85586.1 hypothetical protein ACH46_15270 [Gordonia phthalatica]